MDQAGRAGPPRRCCNRIYSYVLNTSCMYTLYTNSTYMEKKPVCLRMYATRPLKRGREGSCRGLFGYGLLADHLQQPSGLDLSNPTRTPQGVQRFINSGRILYITLQQMLSTSTWDALMMAQTPGTKTQSHALCLRCNTRRGMARKHRFAVC